MVIIITIIIIIINIITTIITINIITTNYYYYCYYYYYYTILLFYYYYTILLLYYLLFYYIIIILLSFFLIYLNIIYNLESYQYISGTSETTKRVTVFPVPSRPVPDLLGCWSLSICQTTLLQALVLVQHLKPRPSKLSKPWRSSIFRGDFVVKASRIVFQWPGLTIRNSVSMVI